jgi:3-deoxy-D-arabino-heptulosonate 7-phosphate (DAHP) synthase class II
VEPFSASSTITGQLLQLSVEEANGVGKANVGVVEIAEAAESADSQRKDQITADLRQDLTVDVVLNNSRQTPVNKTRRIITQLGVI